MEEHKHPRKPYAMAMIASLLPLIVGCAAGGGSVIHGLPDPPRESAVYPESRFAVVSDLHYFDSSLGATGSAFEEACAMDRKLLADSSVIVRSGIGKLAGTDIDFVLIAGDLTKDGEMVCHERVSAELKRLVDRGIKVCVVPGNHDVANPAAVRYEGGATAPVQSISPSDFAAIYWEFGYRDAIARDSGSLSYVSEPVAGLWIVALDTCRYRENRPGRKATSGGGLSRDQAEWLSGMLDRANSEGKAVILLQHHGIVEHWDGQRKMHKDFLIAGYRRFGETLARRGVRLAFTGHYHSQDVARGDYGDGCVLYDIETGSLVTPPCPVRLCSISGGKLALRSFSLIEELHPGTDYARRSEDSILANLNRLTGRTLAKMGLPERDAAVIAEHLGRAYLAHANGDEAFAGKPTLDATRLGLLGRIIYATQRRTIDGMWTDTPPRDNELELDL